MPLKNNNNSITISMINNWKTSEITSTLVFKGKTTEHARSELLTATHFQYCDT